MSAAVIPQGPLPRCVWCERREAQTCPPRECHHLAGDPVDRAGWFAEQRARLEDRADIDDERQARLDRGTVLL